MIKNRKLRTPGRRRTADEGATAVEFAMVAGPLIFILFATLELALVFVVSTMTESALSRGARTIRTGQQQNGADVSAAAFKDAVCGHMVFLEEHCQGHLTIDVRSTGQFTSAGAPDPVQDGEFDSSELTFAPAGPNQIMLVRGFYQWPLITPFLEQALGALDGNIAVIHAADTFRNEPF
jgi:Flp pilus assembly protein TadG